MSSAAKDGDSPLPFERLEVVDDRVLHGGALNMATDEVLLQGLGETPILRIYRWQAPAVSCGYFERLAPVRAAYPQWEWVRRWTGGGVVEHGRDVTYSLLVPRAHPFARQTAADTYRYVHEAVARALARAGWGTATLADRNGGEAAGDLHACFVQPVRHDLMLGGRKIAGAAQRRTRHGLLHQGSVQGPATDDGSDPAAVLGPMLAEILGTAVATRNLSADETSAAHALAAEKYGTAAWLQRF